MSIWPFFELTTRTTQGQGSTMTITAANDAATYTDVAGLTRTGYLCVTASSNDYPVGATALTAASGNVAAAVATATLAGAASVTTYITGFEITGAGATAASVVNITVTGTISGTLTYTLAVAAGATLSNQPLVIQFSPAIPASAVNTSIVVSCPSLGTGNTNNTVVAHGYRK
jgi:hypothetical protein